MLELVATLYGHEDESRLWHVAWSNSGAYLASCGEDKIIRVWDGSNLNLDCNQTVSCVATLEDGRSRTLRSCEWSPNDRMIASASFDGTVVIWESQSSNMTVWEQLATLEGHDSEVKSVSWSRDGRWLATCGRDKRVWIWEMLGGSEFECISMLEGHTQDVKFVKWHPTSSSILISASYDDTVKIWTEDNDDWYCAETLQGHSSTVWGLAFDTSGNKMLSCSDDRSLFEWECDGQEGKGEWRISAKLQDVHKFPIYSVDWSSSNGYIVTGGGDNMISLSSSDSNSALCNRSRVIDAHIGDVNCVRWNPRSELGNLLASTGDDGCLKLWRLVL
jgi:cytosolic iron-sulfur protein assembly protein CIAO1